MKTRSKYLYFLTSLSIFFFSAIALIKADDASTPPHIGDLTALLVHVVDLAYAFGAVIFLVIAIIIGIQYMTTLGDPKGVEDVRQKILYWVVGFVLFFMSAASVGATYNFLSVKDCNGNSITPGFHLFNASSCPSIDIFLPGGSTQTSDPNSPRHAANVEIRGTVGGNLQGVHLFIEPQGASGFTDEGAMSSTGSANCPHPTSPPLNSQEVITCIDLPPSTYTIYLESQSPFKLASGTIDLVIQ